MATSSLPHPAAILADVESFFDALPAKRRRSRLDLDITPEIENYGATNTPKVVVTCELNRDALIQLHVLLHQLGEARGDYMAQLITARVYHLLGLPLDGDK